MPRDLTVRFRVDFGRQCSIGIGKIELLEGIARSGSLSEAARQMRMSYRRAWLLLADLNTSFDEAVARASTGGRGGGGAVLTPFGERLIAGYRKMESGLQPLAATYFHAFGKRVKAARSPAKSKKAVPVGSIKRKASAH
ncbi:MAG TPA: LysR family transcriptional regulator [Steroidobacteraceae bacterium]|jgi:molybdate transport system regulatory protein|nr:LysR family transcriptional regulator [Steroidobacteraceae bacterium]